MTNLGLVGYNKRFLYAAVGAPVSTHDTRLLKVSLIFHKVLKGDVLPGRVISLGDLGYVSLVTVGDRAFPRFSWLIKRYNENTRDKEQRYFKKKVTWNKSCYRKCIWNTKREMAYFIQENRMPPI